MKKSKKTAFTLIELLVVISIIAVLMSIMMPALRRARAQAQMVACKSQLRDLGTALNMYITENNGKIPDSQGYNSQGQMVAGKKWFEKVAPYYNRNTDYGSVANNLGDNIYNFDFFRCPTQLKFAKELIGQGNLSAGASGIYGCNVYFTNYGNTNNDPSYKYNWRKASSIRTPSGLPLLGDISMEAPVNDGAKLGLGGWLMRGNYPHPNAIVKYGWQGNLQRKEYDHFGPAPNHDGKTNYLFADGHVETLGLWPWQDHIGTDFHPVRNVNVNP